MNTKSRPRQQQQSMVLKFYERYEYLAECYAKQIYSSERIGFDYEDLLQEMKLKIYTSIIQYAEKWNKWLVEKRYKPIAIEVYIKSALVNKMRDFIKNITDVPIKTCISIEDDTFDYSVFGTLESIKKFTKKECICEINGVDLFEGLTLNQSRCFMLYLRGFGIKKLSKMFHSQFDARSIINNQIELLHTKETELNDYSFTTYTHYSTAEEC